MKKKRFIVVGVLALMLLIVIGVVYYAPKKISMKGLVWSRDGEAKEVTFDVRYHRRLFQEPKLTGTIILDGTEYVAVREVYNEWKTNRRMFVVPTTSPIDVTEYIYVQSIDSKLDCVWIHEVNAQGQCSYFGPAQTPEEAKQVMEKIASEF